MYKWIRKVGLFAGTGALAVSMFATNLVPGYVGTTSAEASSTNVELTNGSSFAEEEDARRNKKGKKNKKNKKNKKGKRANLSSSEDNDDDGFGFSGRRWRGD